jgi:uncharacterized protein (TIGR00661 family)
VLRVLYGVVGEGMGHAMRSAVLLEHLTAQGHEMQIVGSGRAVNYLEARHPDIVTRITGLTMVYEDNVVKKRKTAIENLKALKGVPENLKAYTRLTRDFSPDVVVSDFESWTYWFARGQGVPIVSVDNMQIIPRCHHDEDVLAGAMKDFLLTKSIVRAKLPRCNRYLITTFFYPPVKRDRTSLHPPILRRIILDAKARVSDGEHVLVYQSGTSHNTLVDELKQIDVPFRIYGLKRDIDGDVVDGNLTHRPFSETTFIDDLASARAVLAGGGFTLMGEAIYLGKPMLSVPLVGQFEQVLNAAYLEKLGYGAQAKVLNRETVEAFLARTDDYRAHLASFEHDDNAGVLAALDQSMNDAIEEGARA